jgi:hypothetical protein
VVVDSLLKVAVDGTEYNVGLVGRAWGMTKAFR